MIPQVRLLGITMPVDDPDYETSLGFKSPLDLIEYAGRWDYGEKSVARMGESGIIGRWLASGEESMVEMVDAAFLITCSRVVSHELVRHRIASYQQESQRFVKYDQAVHSYIPPEIEGAGEEAVELYLDFLARAHQVYVGLKEHGVQSQIARYVLPNATQTRIIAKMNLREWRHVLRLRMHTSAQPEMREVARLIHGKLQAQFGLELFPYALSDERSAR